MTFEFRRGFVESIVCLYRAWKDYADAILEFRPVRNVALVRWPEVRPVGNNSMECSRVWLIGREKSLAFDVGETPGRDELVNRLLELEWPGIHFDLPPWV